VFHEGTFRALVAAARRAQGCLRYAGTAWELIERGRAYALYRPAGLGLAGFQERVEQYELHFYSRLLHGCCGPDGILRPRSHLIRASDGTYRPARAA